MNLAMCSMILRATFNGSVFGSSGERRLDVHDFTVVKKLLYTT